MVNTRWSYFNTVSFPLVLLVIATRQVEGNYQKIAAEVMESQKEYNSLICQALSGQLPS